MSSPRRLTLLILPLLLGLASGCGDGEDTVLGESMGQEACTEDLVGVVDPTLIIDDMEDTDPQIAAVGDRNGTWWLSTDLTDGTTTPEGNQAAPPERILGGRCGSKYAMRITGEGFTE
jgi:hypothetical protein